MFFHVGGYFSHFPALWSECHRICQAVSGSLRLPWLAFYLACDIYDCSYSVGPRYCPNLQLSLNFKYVRIPLCSHRHLMAAIPDQLEIAERVYSRAASLHLWRWQLLTELWACLYEAPIRARLEENLSGAGTEKRPHADGDSELQNVTFFFTF